MPLFHSSTYHTCPPLPAQDNNPYNNKTGSTLSTIDCMLSENGVYYFRDLPSQIDYNSKTVAVSGCPVPDTRIPFYLCKIT